MADGGGSVPVQGPVFDYAAFGWWYDRYRVAVLEPSLSAVEAMLDGLLRDTLSERDLARIRGPVGRVKSKPRVWRKLRKPGYAERIGAVDDIPDVIDDLLGVRLTCTNKRDIDVVREVVDGLSTIDDGRSELWLDPDSERDYLDEPRPSGYRGWHINLAVGGVRRPVTCELQVRTLLQDGWGELTHEDTYKKDGELPPLVEVLSRRLADLLATLDDIAEDLRDELDRLDQAVVDEAPSTRLKEPGEQGSRLEQRADATALLNARWRGLDRPVNLASLAWELQREYGAEITDDWFGSGTFKRLLHAAVPDGEITTGRHAYLLPASAAPSDALAEQTRAEDDDQAIPDAGGQENPVVPPIARALHRVDRTFPLLAHRDWVWLFDHLAEAWRRTGAQPPTDRLVRRLTQSTCDRSSAAGRPLAQRHVEPVVRDIVAESDGQPRSAEELSDNYASLIQRRLVELHVTGAGNRSSRAAVRRWIASA